MEVKEVKVGHIYATRVGVVSFTGKAMGDKILLLEKDICKGWNRFGDKEWDDWISLVFHMKTGRIGFIETRYIEDIEE